MADNTKKNSISTEIDLSQSEQNPGFILEYIDQKGVICNISSILAENDINIVSMNVTRNDNVATMICEVEGILDENIRNQLGNSCEFLRIVFTPTDGK